jgi:hypothetical protein
MNPDPPVTSTLTKNLHDYDYLSQLSDKLCQHVVGIAFSPFVRPITVTQKYFP